MCGIAGIFHRNGSPASSVNLKRMTDIIAHRGPDGEGFFVESGVGLGHRRLKILDLSEAAHQPMMSPSGRYVISYNGEIYNFRELRAELEAKGFTFHSSGDTAILVAALDAWGIDALKRLNGMFAFAVWDRKDRRLYLARDRYGIKPLYYAVSGNTVLFGSEIKAILASGHAKAEMDLEGLVEYFTFQNFFTEKTLLKDIALLPAGHWIAFDSEKVSEPVEYWDFSFVEPEAHASPEDYESELNRLMLQAVSRQLVSDREVSSYLSGGMDSGSLTALAAQQSPYIKTFTVGFDLSSASGIELGFDERRKAEYMSYVFRTEHYEMVLKAGDMERCLADLTWHLEEPRVGQSYPNYYAARLASKFSTVVLAGTGGDELFGGYPWRYYRALGAVDFETYVDQYYSYWQRLIAASDLGRVFKPVWKDVSHVSTRDIFRGVFQHHAENLTRPEDYINHSLYFEAKTFLHGLLTVEDKLSMAHSLESRVPFLDNDLVDFAQSTPVRSKLSQFDDVVRINENEPGLKTQRYFQKTNDGKILLRQVMKRYIPEQVADDTKQGFSAPDASWFRGESIDFVKDVLMNGNAKIYDFLDQTAVRDLVSEHLNGKTNRRLLIWSLLNVEEFIRQFTGPKARFGH
ncbi:MAG: asparagine synthase (glutamine-hydrolyzing) [Rhodobacteraceae bacterium]|nr:asparagine synthase (glutamine-hydrolyzing) [Paracoccaceae bacterium]